MMGSSAVRQCFSSSPQSTINKFILQLLATSRQLFAFARDGALPFSSTLHRINSYTGTPFAAVWFCATGSFLIGLLAFAGETATNAIFAMSVGALYLAYIVPIACFVLAKGTDRARVGPFTLGRFVSIFGQLIWIRFE